MILLLIMWMMKLDDDDNGDDIYIMMKCLSVCLSRKMIIVCLFVMFYGFAR